MALASSGCNRESAMQFETRIEPNFFVLKPLEARVDAHVSAAFRAALLARIDQGHHNLLIDMEKVEFIDSSGLGALVSALKRIGGSGELRVCALRPSVRSMFELTRLNRVIPIAD
jgi:anti-sigma B factor antagonist